MLTISDATSPSLSTGFRFKSRTAAGAIALLASPGLTEDIESGGHVIEYIKENFDSWREFANSSGRWALQLEDHEIVFVCTTIKTTRWVIAAFQGDTFRDVEGHISGSFATLATAGISIRFRNEILSADHYRFGPRSLNPNPVMPMISHPSSSDPTGDTTPRNDQCLFINYYKMRIRLLLWKRPIKAAAGAATLPSHDDDDDNAGPNACPVSQPSLSKADHDILVRFETTDPVDPLLWYILEVYILALTKFAP